MRLLLITIGLFFTMASCNSDETTAENTLTGNTHKVVVSEVLQTNNYTYLLVKENDAETWLAVPKMIAEKGLTYFYDGGMLMENFESKELNRTFEKIYFLESVRTTPEVPQQSMTDSNTMHSNPHNEKPVPEQSKVEVTPIEGGISIGDLFSDKTKYEGKTVTIKGVVAKFNPQIMKKNWIHIQDGTEYKGEFDLTITSQSNVKVGDTIIVEGKIYLDKDFGYGYFYNIIMEDAVIK